MAKVCVQNAGRKRFTRYTNMMHVVVRPVMSGLMKPALIRIARFAAEDLKRPMKCIFCQMWKLAWLVGRNVGDRKITNTKQTE